MIDKTYVNEIVNKTIDNINDFVNEQIYNYYGPYVDDDKTFDETREIIYQTLITELN